MKIFKRILQIVGTVLLLAYLTYAWIYNTRDSKVDLASSTTQTIKVGTEGTYEPFSYYNKDNKLVGFDVDIARAIFKELNMKVEFVDAPWDSMLAAFNSGKTDVVFNQVGITPERTEKYAMTAPYSYSHAALIVNKNNQNIKSFSDLKGKSAAQSLTSNYGEEAQKLGARIVNVDSFAKAVDLIDQERVDATLNDDVVYYRYLKVKKNANIKLVETQKTSVPSGAMFHKKDKALAQKVSQAIEKLRKKGELKKISVKYFGKDITAND